MNLGLCITSRPEELSVVGFLRTTPIAIIFWIGSVESLRRPIPDERIPGDVDFVEDVLSAAQEQMEKSYTLVAKGYDLDKIASKVSDLMQLKPFEIWAPGKERKRVEARSLLCY